MDTEDDQKNSMADRETITAEPTEAGLVAVAAFDDYARQVGEIWAEMAEASAQLASSITDTGWNAPPIARPGGIDTAGCATVLAARLGRLGPDGDPMEMLTLGLIAYARGAHDQARAEYDRCEQARLEILRGATEGKLEIGPQ